MPQIGSIKFSMKDISCLDLLRLATHPEVIEQMIITNRHHEKRPLDALEYPDETIFKAFITLWSNTIDQILAEANPGELVELWAKHAKWPKKKGRPQDIGILYNMAEIHRIKTGKTIIEVYQEMVLPLLIKGGFIGLDPSGDPDPIQELAAKKNYRDAMSAMKHKHSG